MDQDLEYVGFWARTGAALIDLLLQLAIVAPLTMAVYGRYTAPDDRLFHGTGDILINVVLPALAVLAFWIYKGATPGKMVISARIVDAGTGEPMTKGQAVLRYLAYFVSLLPLGLGYLWVALDRRKQGWHDKIAGTVVVRPAGQEPVRFPHKDRTGS
ncbi:MAG: hypothetical protein JWP65_1400 [Ramlibacter sp.]|jgi:uncharacterized RDD family membrane protein YckC|uniref:RDD family protein n=1 Tax=Ramlibacter sp. TaxID=1917967 RepID=UPI00261615E2|nr:RDD family protein [Ramlibacter sp.]MDB5750979.1 hypothetical protein [Ramlibacter sp.]